jgi:PHD/YefM family antitoxin component YafN of YafNO toxin-antitoxin module
LLTGSNNHSALLFLLSCEFHDFIIRWSNTQQRRAERKRCEVPPTRSVAMSSDSQPLLIHLHIPKNAGTTLGRSLRLGLTLWPPRQWLHYRCALGYYNLWDHYMRLDRIASLGPKQRRRIRLFEAHAGFGLHKHLPSPSAYITLLRDPVDRVLSIYFAHREGGRFAVAHEKTRLNLPVIQRFIDTAPDFQLKFVVADEPPRGPRAGSYDVPPPLRGPRRGPTASADGSVATGVARLTAVDAAPRRRSPHRPSDRLLATLHRPGTVPTMSDETRPLKVPITTAAERGVSWLNETAEQRRVILTRFGQPGAVVDSAARLDETARVVTTARQEIVEQLAELAAGRTEGRSLDDVCARLGIDADRVRKRASELAG